jgi:hypothetical protein
VALTWESDAYGWSGAAAFGDSGSPVRVTGFEAAGNLTHLIADSGWLPSFIAGTRIGRMEQIAGRWTMLSSSLCLQGGEADAGDGKGWRGQGRGKRREAPPGGFEPPLLG